MFESVSFCKDQYELSAAMSKLKENFTVFTSALQAVLTVSGFLHIVDNFL